MSSLTNLIENMLIPNNNLIIRLSNIINNEFGKSNQHFQKFHSLTGKSIFFLINVQIFFGREIIIIEKMKRRRHATARGNTRFLLPIIIY